MLDKKRIERFLAGEGTTDDRNYVIDCFSSVGEEKALRELSRSYWDSEKQGEQLSRKEAVRLLDRIHHTMQLRENKSLQAKNPFKTYLHTLSRVAAVLFIPLLIAFFLFNRSGRTTVEGSYSELFSPPGARTMFQLPDGSTGWLNSGSSLQFPVEFTGKTREVQLTGEAYFDVESSPKRPFVVQAGNLKVKATGTVFNVRAYSSDPFSEVTLVEGSIDLSHVKEGIQRNITTLEAGKVFLYGSNGLECSVKKADVAKNTAWKDGKLLFRDDHFTKVVQKINRWYNVNVEIVDHELEDFTYVGTFQNETLDEVLKLLALTAPIEYTDQGRQIRPDGTFEKRRILLKLAR